MMGDSEGDMDMRFVPMIGGLGSVTKQHWDFNFLIQTTVIPYFSNPTPQPTPQQIYL